jgi:D-3-phosphoglycerate dehydrogenase
MLEKVANVDCAYNMTPEELYAKIAQSDALIVRSATKVRQCTAA